MRFVLASASPARLATLRAAGVEPEVIVSGVDESTARGRNTAELVRELAWLKATAVANTLDTPAIVLGCDSLLEFDGRSLGKPRDPDDARARWREMRGRTGVLHTGHAFITPNGSTRDEAATTVRFADITDDEIERYLATGEPLAVAGAFTLDGLGGWFVEGVDGDPHNVVGLSLPLLRHWLGRFGYDLSDIGWPAPR